MLQNVIKLLVKLSLEEIFYSLQEYQLNSDLHYFYFPLLQIWLISVEEFTDVDLYIVRNLIIENLIEDNIIEELLELLVVPQIKISLWLKCK